ncbi:hypothetical protein [Rickettsia sp. TH2014]|uniref:hypothetical protein n=1 Tax=Rickettsia sp. TH2014 TaxID=1967503 RepID=UPI001C457D58|nr:hypothetical protein [Rickettsia sp. TH2014]
MTLSGIFGEIRSQPETNIVNSPLELTSKEKNTLNVDNNENALDAEIILSMTLSGIDDEVISAEESALISPSDADSTALTEPKNENALSVDNNENALSINVVVAFCWWAVNYIIASVANICNYRESPSQQQQEEPFDIAKLWFNDPVISSICKWEETQGWLRLERWGRLRHTKK